MLEFFTVHFPEEDQEYRNFSPIHKAILGIEGFTLSQVLEHNTGITRIPINVMDSAGKTALHWAALRGDLSAVERLLDEGADVNAIDQHLRTPLSYAVDMSTSPRIVELLILSRAEVNCPSDRGCTPLHYASRRKASFRAVQILIRAGAKIDVKNRLGNTAFVGAATHNNTAIGRILLEEGADRYNVNHYGDTPLRECLYHNSHEFLSMLLKDGTRYNDINKHGASLLHAVALEGDFKTIEILKAAQLTGLDPQLLNSKGETAMDVCKMRDTTQEFRDAFSGFLSSLRLV
ncbi:ankyrin repeat-containing domain protein [Stachybotrys elegans]|uniref:Ankyrin repeat-containing domain protein n=1 Tax=Stachybotrys elegans TaxID=80388 RepID=A0A8K0WQ37_9HYPO|nr:ankyrin repeat-containing domain protein [Stachybotrys elegans]